jgi:DNA topoisomerase I
VPANFQFKNEPRIKSGKHAGEWTTGKEETPEYKTKWAKTPGLVDAHHNGKEWVTSADNKPLSRFKHLAELKPPIPPAWKKVGVSLHPENKVLAKGRDVKGRSQQLPPPGEESTEVKMERIAGLEKNLPNVVKKVNADRKSSDSKLAEKADLNALIIHTGVRVGSEKDTKAAKKATGATTLQGQHVKDDSKGLRLSFIGKDGVPNVHPITDPSLQKMVRTRAKKAGAGAKGQLFPNTNEVHMLAYNKEVTGDHAAKTHDYRSVIANRVARHYVDTHTAPKDAKEYKKMLNEMGTEVSKHLNNKPTQSIKKYIDKRIYEKKWKIK